MTLQETESQTKDKGAGQYTPDAISELVRGLLDDANGDAPAACALLIDQVTSDPKLFAKIMTPHVDAACWEIMRGVCRHLRRDVWVAPNYDKGGNGDRLVRIGKALFDQFRLPIKDTPLLRDATHEQMKAGVAFWETVAKTQLREARFTELVMDETPAGKTPAEVMNGERFLELRERAVEEI